MSNIIGLYINENRQPVAYARRTLTGQRVTAAISPDTDLRALAANWKECGTIWVNVNRAPTWEFATLLALVGIHGGIIAVNETTAITDAKRISGAAFKWPLEQSVAVVLANGGSE